MQKEEVIKKYVKDLSGLLREINSGAVPSLLEVYQEDLIYENAVTFIFARLFDFFDFANISFARKGLDAQVLLNNGDFVDLEFEVFSGSFTKHGHLSDVGKDDRILVICWEDTWQNPPSNIDILALKDFWRTEPS